MADGLAFPDQSPVELEFRDGRRVVPEYLVAILGGLETHRYTYEEAILLGNKRLESDFINGRHADIVAAHFRELRWG